MTEGHNPPGADDILTARSVEIEKNTESRLVRLETDMKYLATKNDIEKLKVWIIGGALAGLLAFIIAIIHTFTTLLTKFVEKVIQ